jgi:hypothetical protein
MLKYKLKQEETMKLKMTFLDKIIFLTLLILSFAAIFLIKSIQSAAPIEVAVFVDGRLKAVYPLSSVEVRQFVQGELGKSHFEIKEDMVRMISSPCLHKICVKQGWQNLSGSKIICIPNKVYIELRGNSKFDSISG